MPLQAFHLGIKAVIAVDGRVLLMQREDRWSGRFWELPGGRMEPGEEIEQTLRRELGEELPGIARVEVGALLHAGRTAQDWDGVGLVLLFYRVQADLPEVVISDEHLGYRWVAASELAALEQGEGGVAIFDYTLTAVRLALHAAADPKL